MTEDISKKMFEKWINDPYIDNLTKNELLSLRGNDKEIEDRFYKELEFGTGGMRGLIGAGTNRMNSYTVQRATQGLTSFILAGKPHHPSIVIAYDSRRRSAEFALECALVCAGNGIKAFLYKDLRPTPVLSFSVRHLKASAGVVITASHNPPEYNGFKVYGSDGGQYLSEQAHQITNHVNTIQSFTEIKGISKEDAENQGLLCYLDENIDQAYIHEVMNCSQMQGVLTSSAKDLSIVYTPLHGSGYVPVTETLKSIGFIQLHVVPEQALPDSEFPTVKSPNPEEKEAFNLAIDLAHKVNGDIIIATDPDSDRMGAAVRDESGQYIVLSGNQIGALILNYLLNILVKKGNLPHNGVIIKSIVTSELGAIIASDFGVETINTLTGFKYIGDMMNEINSKNSKRFIFGYEESNGYLTGNYARDKDAVLASMLICEAAAYEKQNGRDLCQTLQVLYKKYGYFLEYQHSKTLKGKEGMLQIQNIMEFWRNSAVTDVDGIKVVAVEDYSKGIKGLPIENVLKYKLENGSWYCLRPSGTEPKLKYYFVVKDNTLEDAKKQLQQISNYILSMENTI
jgi:phosphoglucomutase